MYIGRRFKVNLICPTNRLHCLFSSPVLILHTVMSICQCKLPIHPTSLLPPWCLYVCALPLSVSLFLLCKLVHLYYFSRFHIYVLIYMYFSLLTSLFTIFSFFFFFHFLEPHMMVNLEMGKRSVCILQSGRMEFENKDVGKGPHSKHRCISGRSILWKTEWKLRIWKLILLKGFTCRAPFLASHSNVVSGTEMIKKLGVTPRWR